MRTHPTPPLTRLAAALGLGPGAAPGPSITDPTSPRGSGGSDGALPRPRSARRLGSTAAGGADAAPDTAKPSTSGRWALARWLPAVASLPPHAAVVAFCTAATVVAYIERAGFAIAYARAAGGGGSGGGVGHEGATGAVLAAFYWGYGLSQIPGGWLAQRYGGGPVMAASFAAWSAASVVTPMASTGSGAGTRLTTAAARVAVGAAQGALVPGMHALLAERVPPGSRARAVSLATSGLYAGAALATAAVPGLVDALGPSAIPRLSGALGAAWLGAWVAASSSTARGWGWAGPPRPPGSGGGGGGLLPVDAPPAGSPPASKGGGRQAIIRGRGRDGGGGGLGGSTPLFAPPTTTTGRAHVRPPPWRRLASHPAIASLAACNFAFHYAFYVLMNWMPALFESRLGAPLGRSGGGEGGGNIMSAKAAAAGAYAFMCLTANAGGWASSALAGLAATQAAAGGASPGGEPAATPAGARVARARKAVNSVGFLASAAGLAALCTASTPAAGAAAVALALGGAGFARGGFAVNHMDVASKWAAAVMALSNTAGTAAGLVGVGGTGALLERLGGGPGEGGWPAAAGVASAVCVLAAGVFGVAARGEPVFGGEAWNE